MNIKKYRVIKEGSLPESSGGMFNPGVIADTHTLNQRTILVRKEKKRDFHVDSGITMIIDKIEKLRQGEYDNVYNLKLVGYPEHSKFEDGRLFYCQGEMYCIHTLVTAKGHWSKAEMIKPVIGKVTRHSLIFQDWVDLPYIKRSRMEKNWLPFTYKNELHLLYGLDPLRIYKLVGWSWHLVQEADTGLNGHLKLMFPDSSMLSLSAIEKTGNGDNFIGFYHTRAKGTYVQGMFNLNAADYTITNFTPPVLYGGSECEGYRQECLYVSDIVNHQGTMEVWAGEADSNTCVFEVTEEEVRRELSAHPYKYKSALKILFEDWGVGDCICFLYAVCGWLKENPGRKVRIYTGTNHELISSFSIPGVELWMYNNEKIDIDMSSNEDHLPYAERYEYHKKISGSLKGWYASKLGVAPISPPTNTIRVDESYSDAIIIFPFSSKWEERNWKADNYKELTNRLMSAGYRVVISDQFPARIEEFPGELDNTISIGQVLSMIKGCKLVITNESGGAHAAGLIGTPCLVLSGGLDPAVVNDLTNNEYIYKKPLSSITVQEVFDKVMKMLGK